MSLASSMIDSTLSAQAAAVALRLREALGERRVAELGGFADLAADARVRLQHLAEALALGHASVYLAHVEWLRHAHAARGLGDELARAGHACTLAALREGLPPAALAECERVLAEEARALEAPPPEPASALEGPHGANVARLLEPLLDGRRAEALAVADELERALGVEALAERVLVGAQAELGRMWQRGEIHVGEEHLASRVTEEILARLASRRAAPPGARRVVVASTAGDLHDIGARIVALRLERAGFEACFLGANVPREDLALALRDLAPALLALSVTLGLHLRGARAAIAAAHALVPRVPVVVGGAPFARDPALGATLGADAVAADAADAERRARELVGAR